MRAGLSWPSISTLTSFLISQRPPPFSSALISLKRPRTFDPARTKGEHDLLAAYRDLNTRQQGALLEVARGMAGQAARRKR